MQAVCDGEATHCRLAQTSQEVHLQFTEGHVRHVNKGLADMIDTDENSAAHAGFYKLWGYEL